MSYEKELPQKIRAVIDKFIEERFTPKFESLTKRLEREKEAGEYEKIEKTEAAIAKLEAEHERTAWLEDAAFRLITWLQFGTHTSKGIHPSSRGDVINFNREQELPEQFIGSQAISIVDFDASGNAAALPVANFLRQEVEGVSLKQLIEENHPAIKRALSDDPNKAEAILKAFQSALEGHHFQSVTDGLNKQLLWPLSGAESIERDDYLNIIPLYPALLAYELYGKVQERFSDENRKARANRNKVRAEQQRYFTINDLATTQIGGANPQGVSQLNARQGGRHFLLPSTPPRFIAQDRYLSGQSRSLFNWQLYRHPLVREGFWELTKVIRNPRNDRSIRAQREEALNLIIAGVLGAAETIRARGAGWSHGSRLSKVECLWLDPYAPISHPESEREEEPLHAPDREQMTNLDIEQLSEQFAHWVNRRLSHLLKRRAATLGDREHDLWKQLFREALSSSLHQGGN